MTTRHLNTDGRTIIVIGIVYGFKCHTKKKRAEGKRKVHVRLDASEADENRERM